MTHWISIHSKCNVKCRLMQIAALPRSGSLIRQSKCRWISWVTTAEVSKTEEVSIQLRMQSYQRLKRGWAFTMITETSTIMASSCSTGLVSRALEDLMEASVRRMMQMMLSTMQTKTRTKKYNSRIPMLPKTPRCRTTNTHSSHKEKRRHSLSKLMTFTM